MKNNVYIKKKKNYYLYVERIITLTINQTSEFASFFFLSFLIEEIKLDDD